MSSKVGIKKPTMEMNLDLGTSHYLTLKQSI